MRLIRCIVHPDIYKHLVATVLNFRVSPQFNRRLQPTKKRVYFLIQTCQFILPFCRAIIFWCCCSVTAVNAFKCFNVNSRTTAFSKCPSVYGEKQKGAVGYLVRETTESCKIRNVKTLFFSLCRDLTDSFKCSGNKSFSCPIHSLILSLLFFSINLCGNLYASCWQEKHTNVYSSTGS